MSIDEQRAFSDNVVREVAWLEPPPGAEIVPTGDFTLYTILTDEIVENKDRMTLLGFVLIFFFLLIVYRKGVALTPLVPIICVIGWNPLAMIALGQSLQHPDCSTGSMAIGVGSDTLFSLWSDTSKNTGNLLTAPRQSRKRSRKVGSAVVVSGLVTAAGFSALMLSSFPILYGFGLATVILVIFSLIGAAVVMPATLALTGGRGE